VARLQTAAERVCAGDPASSQSTPFSRSRSEHHKITIGRDTRSVISLLEVPSQEHDPGDRTPFVGPLVMRVGLSQCSFQCAA